MGRIDSKTLAFSSRSDFASSEAGGSIATNPSTWNRCVTIMSRKVPVSSKNSARPSMPIFSGTSICT